MLKSLKQNIALNCGVLLCSIILVGCQSELSSEEAIQRAETYTEKRNYAAGILELKNFLQSQPQHVKSRLMLARLHLLQRDGQSAAAQLQKAKDFSPEELDIRLSLGRALLLQKDYDQLFSDVTIDDEDASGIKVDLTLLHAYAYFHIKDFKQAELLFQQALVIDENNSAVLAGMALVNLERKQYVLSGEQVEKALALDAANMDAWIIKGRLGFELEEYEKAREAFVRAINIKSQHFTFLSPIQAHVYLVQSFILQEGMDEASQAVDDFAKPYPQSPMLHYLRANIAYERSNFEKAGEHIQAFRTVLPDYDPGLLLEGGIDYGLGAFERANTALTQYLLRHPDSKVARRLLALTRLQLQEPQQALELVVPLLKQDPDNTELLLFAGSAMRQAGRPADSIPVLHKLLQQDPENIELKMQLAAAYISNKQTDDAINLLQGLPAKTDEFGERELLMLLAWSNDEDYAAALAFTDEYLTTHPQDSNVYGHSGVILMRMGKVDAARKRFEKALSLKPDNHLMIMALVRLEYQQKHFSRAEELLNRLLKLQPENASAMYALAKVSMLNGKKEEAISLLEQARSASDTILEPRLVLIQFYLKQGDVINASNIGKEITSIAPQRADVWNTYSVIQNKMGDTQGALDSLLVAVGLQPNSKIILMNLARSQLSFGKTADAKFTLRKLLKISPDNFKAASMLALIEIKDGNVEQALSVAKKQQAYKENRLNALALEGDLYAINDEHKLAANAYKKSLDILPGSILIIKRYISMKKASLSGGKNLLTSWLQSHSDDVEVRSLLAAHYESEGSLALAIKEYEILATQKPDDAGVLNNLAIAYNMNNDSKAIQTAEKAYKLNASSAAIKDTLGWILVKNDMNKRGLSLLSEAVAELPSNEEVQYHYAVALNKTGDSDGARSVLQKLLDSQVDFHAREDVKKYLQSLQ